MKGTGHCQDEKINAQFELSNGGSIIIIDAKWVRSYLAYKVICLPALKYFKIGKLHIWEIFTHYMNLSYIPRYITHAPLTFSLVHEHSYEKYILGNQHYLKKYLGLPNTVLYIYVKLD